MKVLAVASEAVPLVKTGGLADVVGALPAALAGEGVEMRVLLPGYRGLAARLEAPRPVRLETAWGTVDLVLGRIGACEFALVDAPGLYDRDGGPYAGPDGRDWGDNPHRFAYLARVGAAIAAAGLDGWRPDAVHAHDWQAGLLPAFLAEDHAHAPPVLFTIHNIAFQGAYDRGVLTEIGLSDRLMTLDGIEYHGGVGFLKAGIALSDRVSTVSPGYAAELMTPEFGMGLDGLLRHRSGVVSGVLNGIDTHLWDPASDPALPARYGPETLAEKARNRAALAERFALDPAADAPLFIVVSRLTWQKGLDLLLEALAALLSTGGTLALLGSGEPGLEDGLRGAARAHPGRIGVEIGYDEALSHLMLGGGDAILVPSRFEPCGLTQLMGLRYGTVPVVARTGGLADTVIDANEAARRAGVATGVLHAPGDAAALARAIGRTAALFRDRPGWAAIQRAGLGHPVGWEASAAAYAALYRQMRP
ncbi:MAG: glycogen synthase GlgA [Paracoccaceae bacterium]